MKCYIVRETTGYPTVIRDGQAVVLSLGDQFTEDELASLTVETYVTYLCTEDNSITTKTADETTPAPAPAAKPAAKTAPAPKAPEEPAAEE